MSIPSVALIYDDRLRPETTGVYCLRAMAELASRVVHVRPEQLSSLQPNDFELYLAVDDGLDYPLPDALRPSAYWAIDTHLNLPRSLARARQVDWAFAAQKNGAQLLMEAGGKHVRWLPLASDPELHRPWSVEKTCDVAFVGNLFPGPRSDLVRLLQQHYPNMYVGRAYFEEMARIYSSARVVFNRSIRDDVNMRVFEALGCEGLLLTNSLNANGQDELLRDGVHLVTYGDADELLDKLRYYLAREELRSRIAAAGRQEVLARHTYRHRMQTILESVSAAASRMTVPIANPPAPPAAKGADPAYYAHARPELLELIPAEARRLLEIGCGHGQLGAALKCRQEIHVVGVEFDTQAAQVAHQRLDEVHVGDVEQLLDTFAPESFDVVVCGDVLEHMRNPDQLLQRARGWLRSTGRLVASIPNVRHHSVVSGLLRGDWTYETAGLLDQTHLRFFTRREIEKLFYRAGFAIELFQTVMTADFDAQQATQTPGQLQLGPLRLTDLAPADVEDFYVYQYLVVATPLSALPPTTVVERPLAPAAYPLTSIILVTHNELRYTRQCLQSIRLRTDEPYELIVVDNGSTDGTVEYLQAIANVQLITNPENRGFPVAANQGIRAARAQQVLLLNNDCVVTTGWLRRLLVALYSGPRVGLVGPSSNYVSGLQQVKVAYESLQALDGWAWDWGQQHTGGREQVDRLVGFCLLMRRELIDAIGPLDERFGIGNYEDDDYCRRAMAAGFEVLIARDAFVHHFGGRTFLATGVDFAELMRRNEMLYRQKWNLPSPAETSPTVEQERKPPATLAVAPGGGLLLPGNDRINLSLCMIVRDSARTLPAALEGIRPWVDELVVVDTGSRDSTPQIAAEWGARVFHFPWCDDFAAARNESLRHARGEWLFWMDSDDTIDAENGRRLRELVRAAAPSSRLGYVIQVHCPGHADGSLRDLTVVDHVKLIRNRPDLRFEGRIHEQVLPAIRRAGGEVAWTDLFVVHSGADLSAAGESRKLARDLRLLELELSEHPEHPFALFNLGMTYAAMEDHARAVEVLERACRLSTPTDSHVRKIYALWISSLMQLGRHQEAWDVCQQGRRHLPDDPELSFREGMLAHHFGWLRQAERAYREALRERSERHFSSIDRGIYGYKARHNLAMVYMDLGEPAGAEAEWRSVVNELPDYREGWRGLGDALVRQSKLDELEHDARRLLTRPHLAAEAALLFAQVAQARGQYAESRAQLWRAVADPATALAAQRLLCRLLFEHGESGEARVALGQLVQLDPTDAAAQHNRGLLALREDSAHEAVQAFHQSLRLRPRSPQTQLYLGVALDRVGRRGEAHAAFAEALRLAPHDAEVRAIVQAAGHSPAT